MAASYSANDLWIVVVIWTKPTTLPTVTAVVGAAVGDFVTGLYQRSTTDIERVVIKRLDYA